MKETRIGFELYIGHNGPIVTSPTAVIGNSVNLSQFTTIESNHNNATTINNNIHIGSNVCIVEVITIGNNAALGARSVVTKNKLKTY